MSVALAPEQRADAAAAIVLRELLGTIRANFDGALSGEDPEYLHQLRISVRRSRTVQRQLAQVFEPLDLPGFRSEFRWLQRVTGEARDLDVYVDEFEAMRAMVAPSIRADLDPLRQVLGHWRMSARSETARALCSQRTDDLLADWEMLLEGLVHRPLDDRPAAAEPIAKLAGKRIRRAYKRVLALGQAIGEDSHAEAYHELRKKGKELRYLLDLFGSQLFAAEVVDPLVRSLKALQDVLGRHQDREVQVALLRSLAAEVAGLPRGPAALMAMGVLVDRLLADEVAARREFAERFAVLGGDEQQALVKATFVWPQDASRS
ncbi:MAG TPA: CHAD domain-containing protein [Solirubrobacteraceae bacterium]